MDLCEWENNGSIEWKFMISDLFPFWKIICLRVNKISGEVYLIRTWLIISGAKDETFQYLMKFIFCYVHYTEAFKIWFIDSARCFVGLEPNTKTSNTHNLS